MTRDGDSLGALATDLDGRVDDLTRQAGHPKLLADAIRADDEGTDTAERARQLSRLHDALDTLDVRLAEVVLASLRFRTEAARGHHDAA